ncbi:MAG TPA: ABC transporter six-transmembrane domain-containing protein [Chitinophagaceae bacterium]
MVLKYIFQRHRFRLLFTYLLFSLEMLGNLLRPFFLGLAIDGLIKGSYGHLLSLLAIHFASVVIGTFRHRYDTRTYSAIYTSLVTNFLSRRKRSGDVSRLSAHSTLSREFVDFMEYDLVYVIEAIYNIAGSIILLTFYDASVVTICLSILVPVSVASYFYGKKMKRLTRLKNDELEKQVDVISEGNTLAIRRHYNKLREWQIRISDQEAWNFGFTELMVMAVIGISLLIVTHSSATAVLPGALVGIYNYILRFANGLDTIPYMVQKLTSLGDITRRIELVREEETAEPLAIAG